MLMRWLVYALWFTGLLWALPVYSADPVENLGERELEQQLRREERERLEQQRSIIDIEPGAVPEAADEGPCFQIAKIDIQGITLLPPEEVATIKAAFAGTCMTREAINTLIYRLTVAYIDRGYITARVYIPQQDLNTGELRLVVVEGLIEEITLNDNSRADRWKLFWAMPAEEGKPLRLQVLEQGLDQINRAPSANATLKLLPGERPGGTAVQIVNKPHDEIRGHIAFDNGGQSSTGEDRIRLGMDMDNLLDINDTWTMFYIGSLDTNALAFNLAFPFRRWSFSLSRSYSEFLSFIAEDADLFGQSDTSGIGAEYLLSRDGVSQWRVSGDLTYRKSKRFVVDVPLAPQRQAPARVGISYSLRKHGSFWNIGAGYSKGLTIWGADEDPDNAPPDAPVSEFDKLDFNVYHSRFLTDRLQYRATLLGQYTDDILVSSEQIHIGDNATVRGYRDTPLSGDKGLYWRNELSIYFPPPEALEPAFFSRLLGRMSPLVFLDYGRLKDNAAGDSRDLLGAGLGLRYSGRRFSLDMSWGRGVAADPGELEGTTEFYLNLSAQAF